MKILYIITKSELGGAQTHVAQLVGHFSGAGNLVALMSFPGGWLENEIKKNGAQFYPNVYFANSYNPIRLLKAVKEIKKAVRDFQPDIIHCHSSIAGFLTRATIRNSVPTIFTSHGWGFSDYVSEPKRSLNACAERIAARWAKKIICVSDFTKELALRFKIAAPEKFAVIYNGLEEINLEKKSLDSSRLRIIFVGRLAEPKEPEVLINAYASLPPELKNKSELVLIGDGPKRSMLEELAGKKQEGKIIFLGSIPRQEIYHNLALSDIFVLASKSESFGLTALEAMAIALPVIVSAVGGLNEVVDEGSGLKVARGSVEEMRKALETLMLDYKLRIKIGVAAQTRVRAKFSLNNMFKETEQVYLNLLK